MGQEARDFVFNFCLFIWHVSIGTYFGSQSSLVEAVSFTVLPWQASTQLLGNSPRPCLPSPCRSAGLTEMHRASE